jgi:hypothetical protein
MAVAVSSRAKHILCVCRDDTGRLAGHDHAATVRTEWHVRPEQVTIACLQPKSTVERAAFTGSKGSPCYFRLCYTVYMVLDNTLSPAKGQPTMPHYVQTALIQEGCSIHCTTPPSFDSSQ